MEETKALAKELRQHPRGHGKRYLKDFEARVRACIATRRAWGDSLERIATAPRDDLRDGPSIDEAADAEGDLGALVTVLDAPSSDGLMLVSLAGYPVEGLDSTSLAALLRALE